MSHRNWQVAGVGWMVWVMAAGPGLGADEEKSGTSPIPIEAVQLGRAVDFTIDVLPILKKSCLACHNEKDPDGGLNLETAGAMLRGGDTGPAVVPGDPDKSLLLRAASLLEKPFMPPKKNKVDAERLSGRELGLIQLWIKEGAKGPARAVLEAPRWQTPPAQWKSIYSVAVSSDGDLAACGRAGQIQIYHLPTRSLLASPVDPKVAESLGGPAAHLDAVQSLALGPDGQWLASGGFRSIKLWRADWETEEHAAELSGGFAGRAVAWSRSGTLLAAVEENGTVVIRDLAGKKQLHRIENTGSKVLGLDFSADGKLLASLDEAKQLKIWDLENAQMKQSLAVSQPDRLLQWVSAEHLATAGADPVVRVWKLGQAADAAPVELKGHGQPVAVLGRAGARLMSGEAGGQVKIWDPLQPADLRTLQHEGALLAVLGSEDAKRLVTVGADRKVRLWAEDGKRLADLRSDSPARLRQQEARDQLEFVKRENQYQQQHVKETEKLVEGEKQEVTKAGEQMEGTRKEVEGKQKSLDQAAEAKEKQQQQLAEADKQLADAKTGMEAKATQMTEARAAMEAKEKAFAELEERLKKTVAAHQEASQKAGSHNPVVEQADKKFAELEAKRKELDAAVEAAQKTEQESAKDVENTSGQLAATEVSLARLKEQLSTAQEEAARQDLMTQIQAAEAKLNEQKQQKQKAEASLAQGKESALKAREAAAAATKAQADAGAARDQAQALRKQLEEAVAKAAAEKDKTQQDRNQSESARNDARKALQNSEEAQKQAQQAMQQAEGRQKEMQKKFDEENKKWDQAGGELEKAKQQMASAERRQQKAQEQVQRSTERLEQVRRDEEQAKAQLAEQEQAAKKSDEAVGNAVLEWQQAALVYEDRLLALLASDGRVHLFAVEDGQDAGILATAGSPKLLASAGKNRIAALAEDGKVTARRVLPDWKLHKSLAPAEPHAPPVWRVLALKFSPDGKILAQGGGMPSREGELVLWDVETGGILKRFSDAHSDTVFDLAFTADGRRLATASADRFCKVFDLKDGTLMKSLEGHTHHVLSVAWNRNGRTLVTSGADQSIKVWDWEKGERRKSIDGFNKEVTSVHYLGLRDRFVAAWGGGQVRRLREDGGRERDYDGGGQFVHAVDVRGDGRELVCGGEDGVLRIYEVENGKLLASFPAP